MIDQGISISCYVDQGVRMLRLSTPSREPLLEIRSHIQYLTEGKIDKIDLHDLENVTLTGIAGFTLKRSSGKNQISFVSDEASVHAHAYWSRNAEGWDDCIFWIDGLLNANIAAHQYLSDENEGAVVVVSYRENSDGEGQ